MFFNKEATVQNRVMIVYCRCGKIKTYSGWTAPSYDRVKMEGDLRERGVTVDSIASTCPDCQKSKK